MQLLTTNCPDCGPIEVPGHRFALFRREQADGSMKQLYRFGCDVCRLVCVKECDEIMFGVLEQAHATEAPDIEYPREEMNDPARRCTEPLATVYNALVVEMRTRHALSSIAQAEIDFHKRDDL